MDVGIGNPGMNRKVDQNIEFGLWILITSEDCEELIGSGCCCLKSGMGTKLDENSVCGIRIKTFCDFLKGVDVAV